MRIVLTCVMLAAATFAASGQGIKCVTCQQPILGKYFLLEGPALPEKQPVCEACAQLKTVCAECGLPVKKNYQTLDDGRLLCEAHARTAIFSEAEALRAFEEAKRDLFQIFAGLGVCPDQDITVKLANSIELNKLYENQVSWHNKDQLTGLTQTRWINGERYEHSIYLLNGQSRSRLMAVAAHEYGHAFLHENLSRDRRLDGDTIEGFCELVAYKLMNLRHEEIEKRVILANTYTKGQIYVLIQADENFQFARVVEWMKTGLDNKIFLTDPARVVALRASPPAKFSWYPVLPTPVPETLMLRGISGRPEHRFALVNDRTLEKNEVARVRLANTNAVVRCLDISENSVLLRVNGEADTTELFLRPAEDKSTPQVLSSAKLH